MHRLSDEKYQDTFSFTGRNLFGNWLVPKRWQHQYALPKDASLVMAVDLKARPIRVACRKAREQPL